MKKSLVLGFLLITPVALALEIGDSYEQVIQELGAPAGKMESGSTQILRYPEQSVKLTDGRVVLITPVVSQSSDVPAAKKAGSTSKKSGSATKKSVKRPSKRSTAQDAQNGEWKTDYVAALQEARAQDRRILLFFTGSDWCGWCKRLGREVLETPEFARYASDNLILVELDFPRGKPQLSGLRVQNERLARAHKITGYPTLVVLDSDGETLGRLGYQEGGPEPFIERLSKF